MGRPAETCSAQLGGPNLGLGKTQQARDDSRRTNGVLVRPAIGQFSDPLEATVTDKRIDGHSGLESASGLEVGRVGLRLVDVEQELDGAGQSVALTGEATMSSRGSCRRGAQGKPLGVGYADPGRT